MEVHSNTPVHHTELTKVAKEYLQMMRVELPKDREAPAVKPPAAKQQQQHVQAAAVAAKQLVPTTAAGSKATTTLPPKEVQGETLSPHEVQQLLQREGVSFHGGPQVAKGLVDCMNGFGELHANISQKIGEIKEFLNNPNVPADLRKACIKTLSQLVRLREEISPGYSAQKSVLNVILKPGDTKFLAKEQVSGLNLKEMDEYYNRLSDRMASSKDPKEKLEIDAKRYELRGMYREKYTAQANDQQAKACSNIFREGGVYRELTHSVASLSRMLLEDTSKIPGKTSFSMGIANFGTNTIKSLTESKIAKNLPADAQAQKQDIASFIALHNREFAGM